MIHFICVFRRHRVCPHRHRSVAGAQKCINRSGDTARSIVCVEEKRQLTTVALYGVSSSGQVDEHPFSRIMEIEHYVDGVGLTSARIKAMERLRQDQLWAKNMNIDAAMLQRQSPIKTDSPNVVPFQARATLQKGGAR